MEGKKILLIGGSSGIGSATAVHLSKCGAKLVLISRNANKLKEVVSKCHGTGHEIFSADVQDDKEIELFLEQNVKGTAQCIDGMVYCVGKEGTIPVKLLKKRTLEDIISVNTVPAVLISKILLKNGILNKNGGAFVFISSVMGSLGQPAKVAYCMSKGALNAATKALALELAPKNIRVNSISPGMVVTEMSQKILNSIDEESINNIKKMHPLGLGSVDDVANGVEFLLSDNSKWITGIDLLIDGGYSAQ
ncbi:MAG: SDR family oxidoreductase [Bergeyella sp.]|nr:SDR family oxidoreductase [Bergeyella sp.]